MTVVPGLAGDARRSYPKAAPAQRNLFVSLVALVATGAAMRGAAFGLGVEPSPAFAVLSALGTWWAAAEWWRRERRRVGLAPGIDAGLFLWLLWPAALPYQLLRYHRARGVFYVALLLGAWIVPFLLFASLAALLAG